MDPRLLAAGLAIGLGTIGPGVGIGLLAHGALSGMARNPESSSVIAQWMIVALAMAEALALYALVVALTLIFIAKSSPNG